MRNLSHLLVLCFFIGIVSITATPVLPEKSTHSLQTATYNPCKKDTTPAYWDEHQPTSQLSHQWSNSHCCPTPAVLSNLTNFTPNAASNTYLQSSAPKHTSHISEPVYKPPKQFLQSLLIGRLLSSE